MTPRRPTRSTRHTLRAALLALALAGIGLLAGPATPAAAHAGLVGASPAQNSVVLAAPAQVVLTFTEGVTPVNGKVRIIAPDGTRADTGDPKSAGTQLVIALRPDVPNGTYLVSYRVISADSHPVGGAYTFSVVTLSAVPVDNDVSVAGNPVVVDSLPIARWLGYVGLLLLVGAVLVLAVLWPQRLDRRGPTRLIWLGGGLLLLATLLELYLQIPYATGGGLFSIRRSDVSEVISSSYGAAHLIRLGVLGAALVLAGPIGRGRGWGADRVLLAVLGGIGVATWSVSGHPRASGVPLVTVASDMVHIASMSVWLGGLVMLIVFLLPRANATELAAIIPVWSRWATYAVGALLLTGLAQAIVLVGTLDALVTSAYGWLLLAKTALVLVIFAVASLSRRLVAPIMARATGAVPRLRMLVIVEASLAVVVLGVTAVLVQTTPAGTASQATSTIQTAIMRTNLLTLSVDIDPGSVGANEIHMYANTPDGQPAVIAEWTVKASNPSQGIEPIDAAVLAFGGNHAVAQIGIPTGGTWRVTFTLRTTEIDEATVTTDFVIRK